MKPVIFEKDGPLGWLTLNRPEKRNALSLELMADLQIKLDRVEQDTDIRVLIIKGNGAAFCAGHDLNEMAGVDFDFHHFLEIFSVCSKIMQTLHHLPQSVIAQVHGIATAAGCQLVAACDLAIAETHAQFATPGVKIGLFCTTPAVPLVRVIGRRRALDMLLSGRFVSAQEAERFGLINRITDPDKLEQETRNWAMELSRYSRFTVGFGKRTFYKQVDLDEVSAYNFAVDSIAMNCLDEDAQEGMKAFLEKRDAIWIER